MEVALIGNVWLSGRFQAEVPMFKPVSGARISDPPTPKPNSAPKSSPVLEGFIPGAMMSGFFFFAYNSETLLQETLSKRRSGEKVVCGDVTRIHGTILLDLNMERWSGGTKVTNER